MPLPLFTGSLTITGGQIPPPVLLIQPGDIILVQSPERMNNAQMTHIREGAKRIWPDHKIIVFSDGLTLSTVREEQS